MPPKRSALLDTITRRTTESSRQRAIAKAGVNEGITPPGGLKPLSFKSGETAKSQGISEIAGELGQKNRDQRIKVLVKSLGNRTTLSSRKRVFNRLAANAGASAGTSGTTVSPIKTKRRT